MIRLHLHLHLNILQNHAAETILFYSHFAATRFDIEFHDKLCQSMSIYYYLI